MKKIVNALIIGGGPAGLAAACSLYNEGIKDILLIDREDSLGGILLQCIHNGFGVHRFKEELTGPEYAERFVDLIENTSVEIMLKTSAIDIIDKGKNKLTYLMSEEYGLVEVESRVIILAMGCRERNRGNIAIPGSRPSGIMTAGLAQKLVNRFGLLPGKEIVILGSGDIGLIMARRMTLEGAKVKGVVEIQPYPGGLNRNIMQCLNDFNIPLYLSHSITNIYGNHRITAVDIAPINNYREPDNLKKFTLTCDSLLLSVGLIPENELSIKAGVELDKVTNGPVVNSKLMTNIDGVFACGNVLHVHDLVDYVSEEAEICGKNAANYIKDMLKNTHSFDIIAGNMVRYLLPTKAYIEDDIIVSLRSIAPLENVTLNFKADDEIIFKKKYKRVFPSEMIRLQIKNIPEDIEKLEVYFE